MEIILDQISKRYRFEWIFRDIDFNFQAGHKYAILGPNGSGKSTFLKILSGHLSPSKGKITFKNATQEMIEPDQVYLHMSYSAPYIELIEEFTLLEAIQFQQQFKPFIDQLQAKDLIELLAFEKSKNKEIKYFSSGMKQRLKLILSLCCDTPVLLLDEPTTNLDDEGMAWYHKLIENYTRDRLVVVATNIKADYSFCDQELRILDYKEKKEIKK